MSNSNGARKIVQDIEHTFFKDMPLLIGDGFVLELANYFKYSEYKIPGYEYRIILEGEIVGTCSMLIENDFNKIAVEGNFGLTVDQKFNGKMLPSKTAKASYSLFKQHGMEKILITHDEGNLAIQKCCEQLSAKHLDTLKTNEGVVKTRYVVFL